PARHRDALPSPGRLRHPRNLGTSLGEVADQESKGASWIQSGGTHMTAILQVHEMSLSFGGLKAVQNFSLALPEGALYGLIGPNGAGKTTVFNLLTGVYKPDAGTITLKDKKLNGLKTFQFSAAGLARTFQNIRLFKQLTVLDNV